ncbi:unnamed protein product [Enterobius vermicularis]|uniref:Uncharacterized protein n=1 Tax=Enterobius vermicularis TaxID=51028 RepID=A0A0N4VHK0_ENTVE|nr:unnamed protein product [Enterobius vermicularis]
MQFLIRRSKSVNEIIFSIAEATEPITYFFAVTYEEDIVMSNIDDGDNDDDDDDDDVDDDGGDERCMPVAAIFRLLIDGRTAGTEWIGQATAPAAAAAAELRMIINERFGNGNSVVYTNFQRFTHRYVCIYSRLLVVW